MQGSGIDDGMVSVILCTTGRRASLDACLTSLRALVDPAHEVLVIENASAARLSTADLASWGARLIHERRPGLDVARNRGAREAVGSIVAYVDDDCVVDPGWLAGFRRAFADPTVGFAAGRVQAMSLQRHSERCFEHWFGFDRGDEPLRFTGSDPHPWLRVLPHQLGTGCNMAFRRSLLLEAGGFDEALDMGTLIGGGGDLDMFARLLRSGVVAAYVPDARMRHAHRTTMRDLRWQFFGYGMSQGAIAAKVAFGQPRELRVEAWLMWRGRARLIIDNLVDGRWRRRGGGGAGFSGRLLLRELLGILLGTVAYPISRGQAWLRQRFTKPVLERT